MSVKRPVTILGGLPVMAEVSFGRDSWSGEDWSEVECLYWLRRDGSCGKPISQKLRDRAEVYDPWLSNVIEQVLEALAWEQSEEGRDEENWLK